MRPLFSFGLGARLGSGRQYMPWISLEDEVRALLFAISTQRWPARSTCVGQHRFDAHWVSDADGAAAVARAGAVRQRYDDSVAQTAELAV